MTMTVAALWRYPVKTLAGELIQAAELTHSGIPGDRVVQVRGPEGVRTSRRHHRLLGLHATLGTDGEPLIEGLPWNGPAALDLVRAVAGDDAWLELGTGLDRFDVLPLPCGCVRGLDAADQRRTAVIAQDARVGVGKAERSRSHATATWRPGDVAHATSAPRQNALRVAWDASTPWGPTS